MLISQYVEHFCEFQLAEVLKGHPPPDFEGREKRIEPNRIHYYSPLKIFEPSAASHLVDHKSN